LENLVLGHKVNHTSIFNKNMAQARTSERNP